MPLHLTLSQGQAMKQFMFVSTSSVRVNSSCIKNMPRYYECAATFYSASAPCVIVWRPTQKNSKWELDAAKIDCNQDWELDINRFKENAAVINWMRKIRWVAAAYAGYAFALTFLKFQCHTQGIVSSKCRNTCGDERLEPSISAV